MATPPLLSILILNYRNPKGTVACAEYYLQDKGIDSSEIFVIDNYSDSDAIGILRTHLRSFPQVRLLENSHNGGFGSGYNLGARYATGNYLLINNPDKKIEYGGIEKLIAAMESDSSIGIIAPKLVHDDGTYRLSPRSFPRPLDLLAKRTFLGKVFKKRVSKYLQLDENIDAEREVDWIAGGCFLVKKEFFEQLHGFDERFFLFFEDTDLCRRSKQAGKKVLYYPSVQASDKKNRLSEMNILALLWSRIGREHVKSAFRYFSKWRGVLLGA